MKRTRRNHGATFKAQVALAAVKGGEDGGGIGRAVPRSSHTDYRMEAATVGPGRERLWRNETTIGGIGSQDPAREDWATDPGE